MSARDVIADVICDWSIRNGFEVDFGKSTNDHADEVIARLAAQGFAIVPKVATDEMMRAYYSCMEGTHPTARMNPDKYLTHNLKAGKRWAAMLKAAKEAVPGGAPCQSLEQAVPETTTNDAQRD
jgi:hypothetical protein